MGIMIPCIKHSETWVRIILGKIRKLSGIRARDESGAAFYQTKLLAEAVVPFLITLLPDQQVDATSESPST